MDLLKTLASPFPIVSGGDGRLLLEKLAVKFEFKFELILFPRLLELPPFFVLVFFLLPLIPAEFSEM